MRSGKRQGSVLMVVVLVLFSALMLVVGGLGGYFLTEPRSVDPATSPTTQNSESGESQRYFISDNLDLREIRLPRAQSARPIDQNSIEDRIYLNINAKGQVLVVDLKEPITTPEALENYLDTKRKEILETDRQKGNTSGKLRVLMVIRADFAADYRDVYQVLRIGQKNRLFHVAYSCADHR